MSDKAAFLQGTLLFRNFAPDDVQLVASIAEERTIPANTIVFSENSIGNAVYFIRRGQVKVSKDIENHTNLPLLVLGEGEFFGEMALIRPGPRLVSVKTLETTEFVVISKEDFDHFSEAHPAVARRVVDLICNWFLLKLRRSNPEFNKYLAWRLDQS